MSHDGECHPVSISLKEYVEFFLQPQANGTTSAGAKLVVKCNLTHCGILRFSKVFRGGENKGENAELQMAKDLRTMIGDDKYWARGPCDVHVIANKSPSIISADHFTQLLRQIRAKLGGGCPVTFSIAYAHPCHYVNQRALANLHRAGIKLSILRVEDILSEAIKDTVTEIKGLTNVHCQKLRGLRIDIDCTMLASAHFMLMNSFEVDGLTVAERVNKIHYTTDAYVQKLKQELKKLQGNARGRIQIRQSTIEKGRRSSSFDPYKQPAPESPVHHQAPPKMTKTPRKHLNSYDESPWKTRMYLVDRASGVMRERSVNVLNSAETGHQEVSLGMEMYRTDYILNGGPNKSSRTKVIDGKWTIQCFAKPDHMFHQEQGLVLKNAYDDPSNGMANPELHNTMTSILSSGDESEIVIEIEIILTALPDKNNFLRQSIQLAEKLSVLKEVDNVILVCYFAGLETFTMPSRQGLRKMLKVSESAKTSKLATILKPLHLQVILNMMMGDLLVSLANFNMVQTGRGVKIKGKINELSAAMHLARSSIRIVSGGNSGNITDETLSDRFTDKHYKSAEAQLENILSQTATKT